MFLRINVPHALVICVVDRPLGVRDVIAGIGSRKVQVRADFLPEGFKNLKSHPI